MSDLPNFSYDFNFYLGEITSDMLQVQSLVATDDSTDVTTIQNEDENSASSKSWTTLYNPKSRKMQ